MAAQAMVDEAVLQPLPAADLDGFCPAGMKRMTLGFLLILGTAVNGLDGCPQERVEQRSGQSRNRDDLGNRPESTSRSEPPGQDGDQG
jgi:hypothetical protein